MIGRVTVKGPRPIHFRIFEYFCWRSWVPVFLC